jgi:hypothetical protein
VSPAHDADALWIELPLRRTRPCQAQRALRVHHRTGGLERHRAGVVQRVAVLARRHAILHDDRGEADGVEPLFDLRAFEIPGENVEAAAGTDEHRAAIRLLLCRQKHVHLRRAHVAEFDDAPSGDELVLEFRQVRFRATYLRGGAGHLAGPELEHDRFGVTRQRAEDGQNEEENSQQHG